jgi:hypothetical protein
MKIRRKSSQSSFFVNPSRTIKSAVESLESSYFPVRRFGSGSFGKISPTFMKSWCSCQNNSNGLQRPVYGAVASRRVLCTIHIVVFSCLFSFSFLSVLADILFDKFWLVRTALSDLAMCMVIQLRNHPTQ